MVKQVKWFDSHFIINGCDVSLYLKQKNRNNLSRYGLIQTILPLLILSIIEASLKLILLGR